MLPARRSRFAAALVVAAAAALARPGIMAGPAAAAPPAAAADSLPGSLSARAFWALSDGLSEPGGEFQSENLLSNETGFQAVVPALAAALAPASVYVGVGPEQNFTYIAAIRPKMAFIIDIRRQNMVQHLLYQALFEMSDTRADFVSRLFSRARPAGLSTRSSARDLFDAFEAVPTDLSLFAKNLADVRARLTRTSGYPLTPEDLEGLERVYAAFRDAGPGLSYNFSGGGFGRRGMPTYADLMTAVDPDGQPRSYLATEANYAFVRDLERRRLIVPVTGDFGGPTAIRAVGQYIRDHGAVVSAFYTSNVEQYLFQGADSRGNPNGGGARFYANVETLPIDASSLFIRSGNAGGRGLARGRGFVGAAGRLNVIASIQETLAAVRDGRVRTYTDLFLFSQ